MMIIINTSFHPSTHPSVRLSFHSSINRTRVRVRWIISILTSTHTYTHTSILTSIHLSIIHHLPKFPAVASPSRCRARKVTTAKSIQSSLFLIPPVLRISQPASTIDKSTKSCRRLTGKQAPSSQHHNACLINHTEDA